MIESEQIAIQQFSEFTRFKNAQALGFLRLEAQVLRACRDYSTDRKLNGSRPEGSIVPGSLRSMVEDVLPKMNGSEFDCQKLRGALYEAFPGKAEEINQDSLFKACSRMVSDGRLVKVGRAFKRAVALLALFVLTGCATPKERSFARELPAIGLATGPAQSVTLAWSPSPDQTVTGYNLYHGDMGTLTTLTNQVDAGPALTATVSNLQVGVTFYFFATAYDADGGESEPSNVVNYTTLPPTPAPPTELRIVVKPEFAESLAGPWFPVAVWPAITLTNPVGQRFYRMDINQAAPNE